MIPEIGGAKREHAHGDSCMYGTLCSEGMVGTDSKSRTVNLFMVYSPLHCFCADNIVRNFEIGARNHLFYLKPGFGSLVDSALWEGIHYLPWPRFNPAPGPFGRLRRTLQNLDFVARQCQGAEIIRLHATVIDTEAVNYHINFLWRKFPRAEFSVRLFPDGILNLRKHLLGPLREALQNIRLLRMLVSPSLRYHRLRGDRTGSDDPIVDRIYVLPGLPHEYETAKTVVLPPFKPYSSENQSELLDKKALVVGQPLVGVKAMTEHDMVAVTAGIKKFLQSQGITRILYKAHPRDHRREYADKDYEDLVVDKPLEHHFSEEPYSCVIGVCSTALVTARMILPPSSRVVAYGINRLIGYGKEGSSMLEETFRSVGIEVVLHSDND